MVRHKDAKHAQKGLPLPLEKENMSTKLTKKPISVASLFEQQHSLRRKAREDAYDVLAPRTGRVHKQYIPSRRSEHNPLFRDFQGTGEKLDSIYQDLIAKVDELAVNGRFDGGQAGEEADQFNAIAAEHTRLAKSLGEDKIEIQRTKADGSTTVQERKLADTMEAFERVLNHRRGDLERLLQDLANVEVEIGEVKEDIAAVEKNDVAKLKQELDAQVATLKKQAITCRETTVSEVEKARKKEKKAADEQKQKFEDFMRSIM